MLEDYNNIFCVFCFFFFTKGNPSDKSIGCVPIDISDNNGANSESYSGVYEQLRQSYSLRFPQWQLSESFSKNYLLQTSTRSNQTTGTIDENYESCQYWWHPLGEFYFFNVVCSKIFLA